MMKRFLSLHLPNEDRARLRRIGVWAFKFTPFVGIERDVTREMFRTNPLWRGITLDITGAERVHGGEDRLCQKIFAALSKRNIHGRAAIAPTIGAAWALSRFKKELSIVQGEKLRTLLFDLPVEALRIDGAAVHALGELGIRTIGPLFELPIKTLAIRFGISLVQRIDQALGNVDEPLRLLKVQKAVTAHKRFETPLFRHESLKAALLKLLQDVFSRLSSSSLRAGSFVISINSHPVKELSLYSASDNFSHVSSILDPFIESVRAKDGVHTLRITALNLERKYTAQESINPCESPKISEASGELLNTLLSRLGSDRVRKASFCESYVPERSILYPPLKGPSSTPESSRFIRDRPSALFYPPHPVHAIALLPDKPPSWFRVLNETFRITQGFGPERIVEEWWKSSVSDALRGRDYFKVQDHTGRWLWMYRDIETLEWFIHGIWI